MIDVDNKISKYLETNRIALILRKEVEHLQNLIQNLEDSINDVNEKSKELSNEIIASIRVDELLTKISKLLKVNKNEIEIKITVISGTYANKLSELYGYKRDDAKDLNSYLSIKLKDGTNICTKDLRLFNDLNEIQADGYILLRHCCLEKTNHQRHDLVINKNISDIICNFRIDAIDPNNYEDKEIVLPMAIRECIKETNQKEKIKIKKPHLVRK
ncbi:MAG: hypothetical protein IKG40_02170 [Bacilli bacterium]|nr:hypothetical protein [Bacilli bacterium]